MKIIAILAMDRSLLIGAKNGLPWHVPEDMIRFKELTLGGVVVMGKNTYFSLPPKFRPLPNRRNIVITRTNIEGVECYSSIEDFLASMENKDIEKCFLLGGASLYDQFFEQGLVDTVELTLVTGIHEGDIFVSEFRNKFHVTHTENFEQGSFISFEKNL